MIEGQDSNDSINQDAFVFTNRLGKKVQMNRIEVPYTWLTSLYRLQETFETREEFLTLRGVLERVIEKGLQYIEASHKNTDKGRLLRKIDNEFDGQIRGILEHPELAQPEDVINLLKKRDAERLAVKRIKR